MHSMGFYHGSEYEEEYVDTGFTQQQMQIADEIGWVCYKCYIYIFFIMHNIIW